MKLLPLMIAVLAIGLVVLPQTVALFEGQHVWYEDESLDCIKCHYDIAEELTSKENAHFEGLDLSNRTAVNNACKTCHQVSFGGNDSAKESTQFKEGKHAAEIVPCERCHNKDWFGVDVYYTFTHDAHRAFVQAALNQSMLPNATEACVACHTHADINITFTWRDKLKFTAEKSETGEWIIGDFYAEGTVTRTVTSNETW